MSTTKQLRPTVQPRSESARLLARAWVSVVLIPAFLLASVLVVSWMYEWFGYKPENADAPLWIDLVIAVVAIVVFLVPCVAAVLYGWQASRVGNRTGLIPLGIGALVGLGLTVLTVVSTLGPF
jgi:hypothetical protein